MVRPRAMGSSPDDAWHPKPLQVVTVVVVLIAEVYLCAAAPTHGRLSLPAGSFCARNLVS